MPRNAKTQGQLEAEISEAVTRFEKEHMGRGPLETKSYLLDDMVIVRLRGVLTKAEHQLVKSDRNTRGRALIKQVRIELLEAGRSFIESQIRAITRCKVRSLHADVSTATGEKVMIFVLEKRPEIL